MSVTSRKRLIAKLKTKAYRDAYTAEHVKTTTPLQIRTVREQREWTQGQLAEKSHTTQTAISRTEDPNYGNLTLNNLLKIAAAFDVGLLVKLVPFSRLVKEYEDLSPNAMMASAFMEELTTLEAWASDIHARDAASPESRKPSLIMTYGLTQREHPNDYPLKLPARGESFELNFPRSQPIVARADTQDRDLLGREQLSEAS